MIFLLRNQLFGDTCILNEGSTLLPFFIEHFLVLRTYYRSRGKGACPFFMI